MASANEEIKEVRLKKMKFGLDHPAVGVREIKLSGSDTTYVPTLYTSDKKTIHLSISIHACDDVEKAVEHGERELEKIEMGK